MGNSAWPAVVLVLLVAVTGCGADSDNDEPATASEGKTSTKAAEPKAEESKLDVAAIRKTFVTQLGGRKIKDMCDPAMTHWACFFDGLEATGTKLQVNLSTDGARTDAELDGLAQKAALHWFNFVGADHPDITWVVARVNGVDRESLMRQNVPLLN